MTMDRKSMKEEFIGAEIDVIDSPNRELVGIKGTAVDETRNTLTIRTEKGIRKLIKKEITFRINGSITVVGKDINFRPEDRIKRI